MKAVELGPVGTAERTQPATDLFLIFAGANIVATTLITGASLVPAFSTPTALGLIAAGSVAGAALVAALAPVGPRLGVPSVIAARAALGRRGADLLALLLYVTNFAWIALNNVIAASVCARLAGGPGAVKPWAVALGLMATVVVAMGPRAVGWALHGCPRDVPWHRVVNASGGCSTERLTHLAPGIQEALLRSEGVRFRPSGTLDLTEYRWHPRSVRRHKRRGNSGTARMRG